MTEGQLQLQARRIAGLALLAGVYRGPHFPPVAEILARDLHGMATKIISAQYELGKQMRAEKGIAEAEKHCAVIPYRLWLSIE